MTRPCGVRILGGGPAAFGAARVLAHHGIAVGLALGPAKPGPDLLLNLPTIRLLQDLFGCEAALRARGAAIRGRLVAWDRDGGEEPDLVEEGGIAIAAGALQAILRDALRSGESGRFVRDAGSQADGSDAAANWTVEARGKAADGSRDVASIGDRVAICGAVGLSEQADAALCAVEATEHAWLFLLPLGGRRAALQAVVPQRSAAANQTLTALLARSRLIGRFVAALEGEARILPCAPRLRPEPARHAWLAAGEAALSFDPLCGDGTGQALRCGLLAAAVIAAIVKGEPEDTCLAHYRNRLSRAMRAHLKATISFYDGSPSREIWRREIETADRALDCIDGRDDDVATDGKMRYRLECFTLVRTPA